MTVYQCRSEYNMLDGTIFKCDKCGREYEVKRNGYGLSNYRNYEIKIDFGIESDIKAQFPGGVPW